MINDTYYSLCNTAKCVLMPTDQVSTGHFEKVLERLDVVFFFSQQNHGYFSHLVLGCHSSLQVPQELFFSYQDHVTLRGSHEGWGTLQIEQGDKEKDPFEPWVGKSSLFCISSPSPLCFRYGLSSSSQTSCVISLVLSVTALIDICRELMGHSTWCYLGRN